jgi:hypothetical protein
MAKSARPIFYNASNPYSENIISILSIKISSKSLITVTGLKLMHLHTS